MCGRQRQIFFLIDLFPQERNTTPLLHSELRRIRPFQVAAAVVVLVTRLAQNAVRHILPCQELRSAWRQRIQFVGDMKLASLTTSCERNGKCQPCKGLDHLFLVFKSLYREPLRKLHIATKADILPYLRLTKLRTFPKIEKVLNFESAQNRPLPQPHAQEEGGWRAVAQIYSVISPILLYAVRANVGSVGYRQF